MCRVDKSCVSRAGGIVGLVLAIIATSVAIGSTGGRGGTDTSKDDLLPREGELKRLF